MAELRRPESLLHQELNKRQYVISALLELSKKTAAEEVSSSRRSLQVQRLATP